MKCTNKQIDPKGCSGEFKPALKAGHIECNKCGFRIKSEPAKTEETPKLAKAKTATDNKEN